MKQLIKRLSWLSLVPLLGGCQILPSPSSFFGPKQNFESISPSAVRFPSDTWQDIVYTVARFNPGHKREFGIDLIKKRGIIPVHLSVALRGEGQQSAKILLNSDRMNMRMYLPDGTSLKQVSAGSVAANLKDREAGSVHSKQFTGDVGLLETEPKSGYVFFQLAPRDEFRSDGVVLTHSTDGISKPLDITRSLITFNVMIDDTAQPVFVGMKN